MERFRSIRSAVAAISAACLLGCLVPAAAVALPAGFADRAMHRGLENPTSIAIGSDDRRFVAEKEGTIEVFDGRDDTTPRLVADLSEKVMSAYDRGLEQIVLDPEYPRRPYLYATYTYNARVGEDEYPAWPKPPNPPGVTTEGRCWAWDPDPEVGEPEPDPDQVDGCQVSGRVAQLTLNPRGVVTAENVILEDWCQQFFTHSIGGIAFDETGALIVAGGDGATPNTTDIGNQGDPLQRCSDPPLQGGALRSQDALTPADPLGLSGTVVRVDPDTGAPLPDNPSTAPGNGGRIVAWGLRNPFRLTVRPGTDEVWIADVGWSEAEEINVTSLSARSNFGWPCFEGPAVQPNYAEEGTDLCGRLYSQPSQVSSPWFSYEHNQPAVPRDSCFFFEGAISGIDFDESADFPVPWDGALFAADYLRGCIWSFLPGARGEPRQAAAETFHSDPAVPVELLSAKDGLYYPDIWGGVIRRISYERPTAEVKAVSRPRGAELKLAGRVVSGPLTLVRGTGYRVLAPRRLQKGKRTLHFDRWSDGGRRIHRVVAKRNRTLRAIYRER